MCIRDSDATTLTRYWEGLTVGASIVHPLAPAGFSPLYGMLKDRFGITWVLSLSTSQAVA